MKEKLSFSYERVGNGISFIVSFVYAIVYFYKLTRDVPYNRWVSPAPLGFLCFTSMILFGIVSFVLFLVLSRRKERKRKNLI